MRTYYQLAPVPWAKQFSKIDDAPYQALQIMAKESDEYGRGMMSILQLATKSCLQLDKLLDAISYLKSKKIVTFLPGKDPGLISFMLRIQHDPQHILNEVM